MISSRTVVADQVLVEHDHRGGSPCMIFCVVCERAHI
jgi:hypothetical protein